MVVPYMFDLLVKLVVDSLSLNGLINPGMNPAILLYTIVL